jgi:hypothetical protein
MEVAIDLEKSILRRADWDTKSLHSAASSITERLAQHPCAQYLLLLLASKTRLTTHTQSLLARAFANLLVHSRCQVVHFFLLNDIICSLCECDAQFPCQITFPLVPDETCGFEADYRIDSLKTLSTIMRISILAWKETVLFLRSRNQLDLLSWAESLSIGYRPWFTRVLEYSQRLEFRLDTVHALCHVYLDMNIEVPIDELSILLDLLGSSCLRIIQSDDNVQLTSISVTLQAASKLCSRVDEGPARFQAQVTNLLDSLASKLRGVTAVVRQGTFHGTSSLTPTQTAHLQLFHNTLALLANVVGVNHLYVSTSQVTSWILDLKSFQMVLSLFGGSLVEIGEQLANQLVREQQDTTADPGLLPSQSRIRFAPHDALMSQGSPFSPRSKPLKRPSSLSTSGVFLCAVGWPFCRGILTRVCLLLLLRFCFCFFCRKYTSAWEKVEIFPPTR